MLVRFFPQHQIFQQKRLYTLRIKLSLSPCVIWSFWLFHVEKYSLLKLLFYKLLFVKTLHYWAPKLIQCIKFSFSLTAGARFRWINNKSVPHSSSVLACRRGKNTCAPSIVHRLLIGWNCHTTWSQGSLHYMRLHFLKLDREFFCLQPSLARLYCASASPSDLSLIHIWRCRRAI